MPRKLKRSPRPTVNFASERVTVAYDPALGNAKSVTEGVIARIQKSGFEIPTATLELPLLGMTCANCAKTIQRKLNKLDGVLDASVNFANERATVKYAAGAISRSELVAAVRQAGFDVVEAAADEDLEDAEAAAREAEYTINYTGSSLAQYYHPSLFTKHGARL